MFYSFKTNFIWKHADVQKRALIYGKWQKSKVNKIEVYRSQFRIKIYIFTTISILSGLFIDSQRTVNPFLRPVRIATCYFNSNHFLFAFKQRVPILNWSKKSFTYLIWNVCRRDNSYSYVFLNTKLLGFVKLSRWFWF